MFSVRSPSELLIVPTSFSSFERAIATSPAWSTSLSSTSARTRMKVDWDADPARRPAASR